jgi:transposase-like protein
VERLVREGRSTTEIASATGVSKTTVRHWLRKWGLRTNAGVRRAAGASAHAAAALNPRLPCLVHGLSEFVLEAGGGYRCRRCRTEQVSKHRRKAKATLVAEAGGCCQICGYRTYLGALQFHHIDPSTKRLEVNARGAAVALDTLRAEARKCALLCSNCHAEVEGGVATL